MLYRLSDEQVVAALYGYAKKIHNLPDCGEKDIINIEFDHKPDGTTSVNVHVRRPQDQQ